MHIARGHGSPLTSIIHSPSAIQFSWIFRTSPCECWSAGSADRSPWSLRLIQGWICVQLGHSAAPERRSRRRYCLENMNHERSRQIWRGFVWQNIQQQSLLTAFTCQKPLYLQLFKYPVDCNQLKNGRPISLFEWLKGQFTQTEILPIWLSFKEGKKFNQWMPVVATYRHPRSGVVERSDLTPCPLWPPSLEPYSLLPLFTSSWRLLWERAAGRKWFYTLQ